MNRVKFLMFLILLSAYYFSEGKTKKYGTWVELELRKDFLKDFAFSISPEFRFQDQFNLDEYMIQGRLAWKPANFLSLAGSYRLGTEIKKKGNLNYNRFALDAQASKKINRLETSFRTRYTNYSDSLEDEAGKYFRPRIKLEWNIKKSNLSPFASYELFHNLNTEKFHKMRTDIGILQQLGKLHRIGIYYRLHDYFTDKQSIHIVGIDYRLRFK
jgi:hypothetical protein